MNRKYALPVIALLQLLSIPVAGRISQDLETAGGSKLAGLGSQPAAPEPG